MAAVPRNKVSLKTPMLKKGANFHLWLLKMTCFLASMELEHVLEENFKNVLPLNSTEAIDKTTADGRRKARAKKDNNEAFGFLQQAMDEDEDHLLLPGAQTKD